MGNSMSQQVDRGTYNSDAARELDKRLEGLQIQVWDYGVSETSFERF